MNTIANIKCRNGDYDHNPLGLYPKYHEGGPEWAHRIARVFAAVGADIMLDMPAGSPKGDIYAASQWRPLPPAIRAAFMLLGERVRADGRRFGLYTGGHFDSTPKTVEADGDRYGSPLSSTHREEWADLYETVNDAFDFLFIDHLSELHRRTGGKGPYWMDKIAEKSERFGPRLTVGGEAFLLLDDGTFDRDAMRGRPFCAFGSWVDRHGFKPEEGEPHYIWLNGHTPWFDLSQPERMVEEVAARGFSHVIVDVWEAREDQVRMVEEFVRAGEVRPDPIPAPAPNPRPLYDGIDIWSEGRPKMGECGLLPAHFHANNFRKYDDALGAWVPNVLDEARLLGNYAPDHWTFAHDGLDGKPYTAVGDGPILFDPEWADDIRRFDAAIVDGTLGQMVKACEILRELHEGKRRIIPYNYPLGVWPGTLGDAASLETWREANEYVRDSGYGDLIDATSPTLYWSGQPDWFAYAEEEISEGRRLHPDKPCIPWIWFRRHQSGGPVATRFHFIPMDEWAAMVRFVLDKADGAIVFSGGEAWTAEHQARLDIAVEIAAEFRRAA